MNTQELAVEHMALAGRIAGRILKRLPYRPAGFMDQQDIHQEARLGLVQAAAKFDEGRKQNFPAYARRRIDGAVLDGLRRNDHLKRCVRAKVKVGVAAEVASPVPLLFPDKVESTCASPDQDAATEEARRIIREAIASLPARLRTVVEDRYMSDEPMRVTGDRLGLSQGRVSQLHARALRDLRRYFLRHHLTTRSFA